MKREMPKLTCQSLIFIQMWPTYFSRWTVEMGGTTFWRLLTSHSPQAMAHSALNRPTCGELPNYISTTCSLTCQHTHLPTYPPTFIPTTCSHTYLYSYVTTYLKQSYLQRVTPHHIPSHRKTHTLPSSFVSGIFQQDTAQVTNTWKRAHI